VKRVKEKKMKIALYLTLCAAMMFGVGCGKKTVTAGAPAAPDTPLHKMTVSAYAIANALDSGEKEFEALYASGLPGLSDDGYAKTVAQVFLSSQACAGSYIGQLKTLTTVDDSNKAQVVGWTQTLVSCANNLISNGVAGIKNADAKQKILTLLAPIPAAISIITDLLGMTAQTISAAACTECAPSILTEVKLGSRVRSIAHRAWYSVNREPFRVSGETQTGRWAVRSGFAQRSSPNQRHGSGQDAGFYHEAKRTCVNPLRESWLFA
jgi:hypothetical protein